MAKAIKKKNWRLDAYGVYYALVKELYPSFLEDSPEQVRVYGVYFRMQGQEYQNAAVRIASYIKGYLMENCPWALSKENVTFPAVQGVHPGIISSEGEKSCAFFYQSPGYVMEAIKHINDFLLELPLEPDECEKHSARVNDLIKEAAEFSDPNDLSHIAAIDSIQEAVIQELAAAMNEHFTGSDSLMWTLLSFIYKDRDYILVRTGPGGAADLQWCPLPVFDFLKGLPGTPDIYGTFKGSRMRLRSVLDLYFSSGIILSLNFNLRNMLRNPKSDYIRVFTRTELPFSTDWDKIKERQRFMNDIDE